MPVFGKIDLFRFQTEPHHFLQTIDDQAIKATRSSGNEPVFILKKRVEIFLMIGGTTAIASRPGWYSETAV